MIKVSINPEDRKFAGKVFNLTHQDLDGAACSIVLKNAFSSVVVEPIQYYNMNKRLQEMSETVGFFNQYDYIFLTDLNLEAHHCKTFFTMLQVSNYQGEVIIIDHHEDSGFLHDPEKNFFIQPGICAAMLVKEYVSKLANYSFDYLDEFINLVNAHDLWKDESKLFVKAKKLNMLYTFIVDEHQKGAKHGFNSFMQIYHKGIKFNNLSQNDMTIIKASEMDMDREWNELNVDLIPGTKIAMIGVSKKYTNEMCHRILDDVNNDIHVVINYNPRGSAASIRASKNIAGMNLPAVLNTVMPHGGSGGHKLAAGFTFPKVKFNTPWEEKWPIVQTWIDKLAKALVHVYPELKA